MQVRSRRGRNETRILRATSIRITRRVNILGDGALYEPFEGVDRTMTSIARRGVFYAGIDEKSKESLDVFATYSFVRETMNGGEYGTNNGIDDPDV